MGEGVRDRSGRLVGDVEVGARAIAVDLDDLELVEGQRAGDVDGAIRPVG